MTLSKDELKAVLEAHEWSWKEGWKVFCQTCGAEYGDRKPRKVRHHKKGCAFAALKKELLDSSVT